jgi:hypothetical protein
MGRTWDTLRREASLPREQEPLATLPASAEDAGPLLVEAEEVPFIEVGPGKNIDASPSVLACERQQDKEKKKAQEVPLSSTTPRRRNVPFRAVFLAAPEIEMGLS